MLKKYSNKEIKRKFYDSIAQRLLLLGYTKDKKTSVFYKRFAVEKYGTIYFDCHFNKTGTHLHVNPTVGFLHGKVEELWHKLMPEYRIDFPMLRYDTTTVQTNIGYLTARNTYLNWRFSRSMGHLSFEFKILTLILSVMQTGFQIRRYCNDGMLLKAMKNHKIGLQITNRLKAPLLLYVMGHEKEAFDLASHYLALQRPTPKNLDAQEPEFYNSQQEAWNFFKRDKDPITYYNYRLFHTRFLKDNR
ncbi:MAG: hypothetical protein AAGB24_06265 [Bacteroidota bacterium]